MLPYFEHANPPTRLVYGPGSVGRLLELMDDLGVHRAVVVCGRTVSRGPQLTAVRAALGDRIVGIFDGVRSHGSFVLMQHGVDLVLQAQADVLISLGGGATIDSAKCIALMLAAEAPVREYAVAKGDRKAVVARRLPPTTMSHIAIPTTAGSSSEVMPWAGARDEEARQKVVFRDPLLIPKIAVLDPEMLVSTGPELTASSGMTAVARALESLYSRDRQPISDGFALQALKLMAEALPRVMCDPGDLDARGMTQVGSLLSGIAADNALVSLVHAVGHVVGGRYGLQHGVAHSMLLPHVARLCLPCIGEMQYEVARALGLSITNLSADAAGVSACDCLAALVATLPLPRRLRDVRVPREDLETIAALTMKEPMFLYCARPFSQEEIVQVLQQVW